MVSVLYRAGGAVWAGEGIYHAFQEAWVIDKVCFSAVYHEIEVADFV
jgi:hypothetical protein